MSGDAAGRAARTAEVRGIEPRKSGPGVGGLASRGEKKGGKRQVAKAAVLGEGGGGRRGSSHHYFCLSFDHALVLLLLRAFENIIINNSNKLIFITALGAVQSSSLQQPRDAGQFCRSYGKREAEIGFPKHLCRSG